MDKVEAKKILKILLEADGGCPVCSATLFRLFVAEFPPLKVEAAEVWRNEYGSDSDFERELE